MDIRGGARRVHAPWGDDAAHRVRAWPLRAYFVALIVLFVVAAVSAAAYVAIQADRDARASAQRNAAFAATTAAGQLGAFAPAVRAHVAGLAGNPPMPAVFSPPKGRP